MEDVKKSILEEAGNIVNGARRKAYGKPEDNFERVAKFWQVYFENTGRGDVGITAADVSPLMRLMKEARLCESPDHRDSFVDIVGYVLTGAEINLTPKRDPDDPWWSDLADTKEVGEILDQIANGGRLEEEVPGAKEHDETVENFDLGLEDKDTPLRTYNTSGQQIFDLFNDEWKMLLAISSGSYLPFAGSYRNAMIDYLVETGYVVGDLQRGYYLMNKGTNSVQMYKRFMESVNDDGKLSQSGG